MLSRRSSVVSVASLALFASIGCGRLGAPSKTALSLSKDEWPPLTTTTSAPIAKAAPVALTASDGTGLRLSTLEARAVVSDPIAFTELTLSFDNPEDRTLEGTFRITLPRGASVSRFAMRVNGEWQEGEVVELQAARRAYEDFLHRKQDPALLEQSAGNEFSARVFPIPAHAKKEIIVSYTQPIGDGVFTLPLRGLPKLDKLGMTVHVDGDAPRSSAQSDVTPSADYVVNARSSPSGRALRSGDLAVAPVRVSLPNAADPIASAVVLVDTSASRALGFDAELDALRRVLASIGSRPVTVASFDQRVDVVHDGPADAAGGAMVGALRKHGALGASNLEGAIRWAGDRAQATHASRVVLLTDGVATAGAAEAAGLKSATASLRAKGVERVDVVGLGGIRDSAALGQIVHAGLARDGVVIDGDALERDVRRLQMSTRSNVQVSVDGATWSWPKKLDGVQDGDMVLVHAIVGEARPFQVTLGDAAPIVVPSRQADRPAVERAIAQAKIEALVDRQAKEPAQKTKLDREIVELSVKHRVLTPLTGMLVLETEQDYARFGIDHKALSDILAVRDGHVVRTQRAFRALPPTQWALPTNDPRAMPADAPAETRVAPPRSPSPAATTAATPAPAASGYPQQAQPGYSAGAPAAQRAPEAKADVAPSPAAPPPPPAPVSISRRPEPEPMAEAPRARAAREESGRDEEDDKRRVSPYTGRFATVMSMLERGDVESATLWASRWRAEDPGDVLALLALGESYEAAHRVADAERAYGSIVDLFPNRADLRRLAGERLERVGAASSLDLAIDTYTKAVEQRPDHPSSHRMLAFALLKRGQHARAFDAIKKGMDQVYPSGRFAGVDRILREDLGLVAAAWAKAEPAREAEIRKKLRAAGGDPESAPSLRFVLAWETDGNDVDFHIHDDEGGHAYYSSPHLQSGGDLYADVTTGYGPECFTIRGKRRAGPYQLEAHYYSRGPMGYGMGKLEIVEHDGNGGLRFEERPFVIMVDQAFVDLGRVK